MTVEDVVETFEGKERGARSLEWVGWGASHHSGHVARLAWQLPALPQSLAHDHQSARNRL